MAGPFFNLLGGSAHRNGANVSASAANGVRDGLDLGNMALLNRAAKPLKLLRNVFPKTSEKLLHESGVAFGERLEPRDIQRARSRGRDPDRIVGRARRTFGAASRADSVEQGSEATGETDNREGNGE